MKITKLKLENYGRFSELEFPLATSESVGSNVTVIVGNNGAGKTTILNSLATSLNWLIVKTRGGKEKQVFSELIALNELAHLYRLTTQMMMTPRSL